MEPDEPKIERIGTCYHDPDTGEYVMPGDFAGEPELRWKEAVSPQREAVQESPQPAAGVETSSHGAVQSDDSSGLPVGTSVALEACPASGAKSCFACAMPGCSDNEPNELLASMEGTFRRCLSLAAKKNADYTAGADPLANFERAAIVGVDPLRGVLVRMLDKLSRAASLIDKDPAVAAESAADTWDDLVNYAAIGRAIVDRRSPR